MKIPRTIITIGILVLFLAAFSVVPRTFTYLHVSWINVLSSGDLGILFRQTGTSQAGEYVLPPTVQAGISLLRANRVMVYRFSTVFEQNAEIRQRLVEGAYPLRYEAHAHHLLRLKQESSDRNCSHMSSVGGVVLDYCP